MLTKCLSKHYAMNMFGKLVVYKSMHSESLHTLKYNVNYHLLLSIYTVCFIAFVKCC
jgi:hypothetical protein